MQFRDFLNAGLDRIGLQSQASKANGGYVEFGYGQVEPNHLSAQRNGQIYAQLPANKDINILEQGQFVKYDYAANENGIGEVNFEGAGEWMLVYNEIKLYRNHPDGSKQWDCEFAMLKDDYQARIYTPYDWELPEEEYHNGMYLNGKDDLGNTSMKMERFFSANNKTRLTEEEAVALGYSEEDAKSVAGATIFKSIDINGVRCAIDYTGVITVEDGKNVFAEGVNPTFEYEGETYEINPRNGQTITPIVVEYEFDDVTADVEDIYEWGWTNDPWKRLGIHREKRMPKGTTMVPRVFKTMPGDIFTTNMIAEEELAIGDILAPNEKGILSKDGDTDAMQWQVVRLYTMPDNQKGVKIMRIA